MALRSSFQNVFVFSEEFVPLLLKKTKSLAIVQCEYELMFVVTCIHGGGGGGANVGLPLQEKGEQEFCVVVL